MLQPSDMKELKNTTKIEYSAFNHVTAYFENAEGKIYTVEDRHFLTLPSDQIQKYLKLAKKFYSGAVGSNLVSTDLQEMMYMTLPDLLNELKNDDDSLEMDLIERSKNKLWVGEKLFLFFYGTYDIPRVGTDGADQEESEDVYTHMMCMVCPVTMTKPGLEVKDGKIVNANRPKVVGMPVTGFLYPAFEERSIELTKAILYTAKPLEAPHEWWERVLDTEPVKTNPEKQSKLEKILILASESGKETDNILNVNHALYILGREQGFDRKITSMRPVFMAAGLSEEEIDKAVTACSEEFDFERETIGSFVSVKLIETGAETAFKKSTASTMEKAAKVLESLGVESDLVEKLRDKADRMQAM